MFLALFDFSTSNLKNDFEGCLPADPFQPFIVFFSKMNTNHIRQSFPGKKMVSGSINDYSVEIKNTCSCAHHKFLDFISSTSFTNRISTAAINIEIPPVTRAEK